MFAFTAGLTCTPPHPQSCHNLEVRLKEPEMFLCFWIVGQKTCICCRAFVLKPPWKMFFERKMKVSKLFKSTNMLFSIWLQHKQFNIFSPELFPFWVHHLCHEKFSAIWRRKKHFNFWDIKVFPSRFTFSCPPWMYQDGALYSWICSKHILANMITSKNEKFHFFQTHSIFSNYSPPPPSLLMMRECTMCTSPVMPLFKD